MGRKERFIQTCIDYCNDDSHGYSQSDRWERDVDCSSLMYICAYAAGYDVPTDGTRYTGTILDHFRAAGFYAQPFDGNVWDLEPGDVILNEGNHVEMCVWDGAWGGAHIDEHGNVSGGTPGDQTGNEVSIGSPYVYYLGWDWVLTPPDDAEPAPEPAPEPQGVRFAVESDGVWNADMVGTHDTGGTSDAYGGELGKRATHVTIEGHRHRVMTESTFPDWGPWKDGYDRNDAAGDGSGILLIQAEGLSLELHRLGEWNGVVDAVTIR